MYMRIHELSTTNNNNNLGLRFMRRLVFVRVLNLGGTYLLREGV